MHSNLKCQNRPLIYVISSCLNSVLFCCCVLGHVFIVAMDFRRFFFSVSTYRFLLLKACHRRLYFKMKRNSICKSHECIRFFSLDSCDQFLFVSSDLSSIFTIRLHNLNHDHFKFDYVN